MARRPSVNSAEQNVYARSGHKNGHTRADSRNLGESPKPLRFCKFIDNGHNRRYTFLCFVCFVYFVCCVYTDPDVDMYRKEVGNGS